MTLKGKSAIVTGSTSGIGQGIAVELAKAGCNIMLNGFGDRGAIENFRLELEQKAKVAVEYCGADMTKPDEIADMVEKTAKAWGSVDIVVNNAGIQHVSPVEDFPPEKWDAIIAINLSSAFHLVRLALPRMKKKGWGRILNIASAHGLVASAQKSAYVASKHGIVGFTKSVALETAGTGVTCNAICPGWVLTPLVQKQIDARAKEQGISVQEAEIDLLAEKQPSKKFTTVEQLGGAAVFLCSAAADNITGVSLPVDGGWTAQ